jgi:Pvc16 N-terminal domain
MSDFSAVRAATETLQVLLKANITNSTDPQLAGVPIDLRSPKEMRQASATGISLWLYRVTRDPDLLNRPPDRIPPNLQQMPGLPIHLFYLITPMMAATEDKQTLLGRVLQVFNDYAIIQGADLQGTLIGNDQGLRVSLEMLTHDEISRIWMALDEHYDLSVTYAVQVVTIDSDREPLQTTPVLHKTTHYAQILNEV